LGPGLLESIYQKALAFELRNRGLHVDCEQPLDVEYRGQLLGCGYRIDMMIEGSVIVENKTVKEILPIHKPQLLTYLKISKAKLGFILNWNQRRMRDGIKRMVLDYEG
jgi:GxxExxY protein